MKRSRSKPCVCAWECLLCVQKHISIWRVSNWLTCINSKILTIYQKKWNGWKICKETRILFTGLIIITVNAVVFYIVFFLFTYNNIQSGGWISSGISNGPALHSIERLFWPFFNTSSIVCLAFATVTFEFSMCTDFPLGANHMFTNFEFSALSLIYASFCFVLSLSLKFECRIYK